MGAFVPFTEVSVCVGGWLPLFPPSPIHKHCDLYEWEVTDWGVDSLPEVWLFDILRRPGLCSFPHRCLAWYKHVLMFSDLSFWIFNCLHIHVSHVFNCTLPSNGFPEHPLHLISAPWLSESEPLGPALRNLFHEGLLLVVISFSQLRTPSLSALDVSICIVP